ncbi:MAG: aconitase X catalytic domain-containing protein [Acidimicrobiia bacterium]
MVKLSSKDRSMLDGDHGEGVAFAMGLVLKLAEVSGAPELIDISGAHIDGCLYHGESGVDFVQHLVSGGAQVAIPTTLNVSSLDLLHPELYQGSDETADAARRLMDLHVELGCQPTWTCAPYQLPTRPGVGEQIAWGESNAIVFANSVLGARTNRYGDFADLACAVTGRAPFSGLHTDAGRAATVVIQLDLDRSWLAHELFYPLLGHWIGAKCGTGIPAIVGFDCEVGEDDMKALGAAAASSGATAMFHAVGLTPEAATLSIATQGNAVPVWKVPGEDLVRIRESLGYTRGALGAVSVGTPHMSVSEMRNLATLVAGKLSAVPFYVNTSRAVYSEVGPSVVDVLAAFGATVVTDTCTYITPIIGDVSGAVMTNSAKWAYYAPGNLGVEVAFGSLAECVTSAVSGRAELDDPFRL